ncbi:MAG TPA: helix-turn-helix transcriptional regulator [Solirubrobacteraceae bacterium]|jgi:transcriptional regulator with XRE-family HTH domain|nr:helix-turn-helix transcriptional regulator [Solirubrobacteraceae bacterium]
MTRPTAMVETDIAVFAANVARIRREKKLSQSQVANRSGIHHTEISRIERGRRDPRLSTLLRLARALKVKPARLLDGI